MIFYFLLISVMLILLGDMKLPVRYSRLSKYVIAAFIIVLLFSVRFDVGFDYSNYYSMIGSIGGDDYRSEPISAILMDLGHYSDFPPFSFFLFSVISYSLIIYTFYRNSEHYNYAFFCYMCFFFLDTLGGVRQALGEAIVFWGFSAIKEKKLFKYIIICFIASLAHKSALLALPIYFLYNIKSIKVSILLIATVGIMMSAISQYISELGFFGAAANRIAEGENSHPGGSLLQFFSPLLFLFILVFSKIKNIRINWHIGVIILFGLILPFMIGAHYGMRVARYYNIYMCFLLANLLAKLSPKIRILSMSVFGLYFMLYISVGWNKKRPTIAPYQTIFQIEDIENPKFR